jgi:NTE family protein
MQSKTIKIFFLLIFCFPVFAQNIVELEIETENYSLPFGLEENRVKDLPQIALVLSGGGSRGLAQIGVLKAFEENNIPIDIVIGTSMGSIVGGLYSAGYSISKLDSIVRNTAWDDFFSASETSRRELFIDQKITEDRALFEFRLQGLKPILPTSLSTGQKVSNFLSLLAVNAPIHVKENFDELLYSFRAVSTDLINGKPVILKDGSLSRAMRASSSVTFLLAPVKMDSILLVDGGLVSNVPVEKAKSFGAEYVIAVNTTSPLNSEEELRLPWNIADQIVSIPMKLLEKQQLDAADEVVIPDIDSIKNTDFSQIDKLIDEGYKAGINAVEKIKREIDQLYKNKICKDDKIIESLRSKNNSELELSVLNNLEQNENLRKSDICLELLKLQHSGDFKKLSAKIESDSNVNYFSIDHEYNPVIRKIEIENNTIFTDTKIYGYFKGVLFNPYNSRKLLDSFLKLISHYRESGYSLASVDNHFFDESTGTLQIFISEGLISEINITGNEATNEDVIRREIPLKNGEVFSYSKLGEGLDNLRATNLFNEIELNVISNGADNKINFNIEEKIPSLFRFGLRIDNENLTQFLLDIRDENLLGTGTEMGGIFLGGLRNRSLILEHKANRVFDTYLTYKLRLFYEFRDINVFNDDSTGTDTRFSRSKTGEYRQIFAGASLGVGAQIEKVANIIVEGKFQNDEVKNKFDYTGSTFSTNIASAKISLSIDSQDKYPFPDNGFLINTYYETAQKVFGGNLSYTKSAIEYKSFFNLDGIQNLSPRFIIGFADKTLPFSRQFSLGGQNSFFGYRDNEFRGRQIFISSLEYRVDLPIQIFFDTYLKVRYDLGSIWAEQEQIRFKDLRHGIGASLSFDTPIGPADFSVGRSFIFKRTLPENTVSWGQVFFYFTIGYYY